MATRIRILPEQLANKIAAGEVVERPASVVKELVENAVDAGASEVLVEIEDGGKRSIRVTDNGSGMSREDALLALERHATSKIASDDDLAALMSLGFRGEAIPAIASVSRLTLASREQGSLAGTEIYAEGGRIVEVKECGMPQGTVVTVRSLFFNTPARRKFLRSNETESGHIGDLLARLALSRPGLRLAYSADGKTIFRAYDNDLRRRIVSLLGNALVNELHEVTFSDGELAVQGLLAGPAVSRSNSGQLYTYVNGRSIRDRLVQHAILQAYRQVLERGRYPVAVLFIELPPSEVDVNVHPTKHEVRFRQQGRVHDAIRAAVEEVLRQAPWGGTAFGLRELPTAMGRGHQVTEQRLAAVRESLASYGGTAMHQERFPFNAGKGSQPVVMPPRHEPEQLPADEVPSAPAAARDSYGNLTVIGQLQATYILCEEEGDLVIIDQHAAHERVAFDELRRQFAAGGVERQGLLFPETVELTFREAAALREHAADLERLGFELEEFGGATWLLKGVPRLLAAGVAQAALRDTLEDLAALGRSAAFADRLDLILARFACHSVVRGVHPLSPDEIRALLRRMDDTEFSAACPHGRPVLRRLSISELARMFRRQ